MGSTNQHRCSKHAKSLTIGRVVVPLALWKFDMSPQDYSNRPIRNSQHHAIGWPRLSIMLWVLLILVALLVLPYVVEQVQFSITRGRQRAEAEIAQKQLAALPADACRYTIVAKGIAQSVVGIETVRITQPTRLDERANLPWHTLQPPTTGQASGVIVDEEGYIITNFHVLLNATRILVKLADGRHIEGVKVVGVDHLTDVALLKIDVNGLNAAEWGDSDKLEVGDPVLAVGNPFGLARTVTAGIISAKERRNIVPGLPYQNFLQTDAAVNPGNSGGPLVDMDGRVVGINTAIFGQTYQGISFAIPSRIAQNVYQQLKSTGKVARGWLGVAMQRDFDDKMAAKLGMERAVGALVSNVIPDSPADRAGLRPGDVIIDFNGKQITSATDLSLAVGRAKVGSQATVLIIRDGQQQRLTIDIAERPAQMGR